MQALAAEFLGYARNAPLRRRRRLLRRRRRRTEPGVERERNPRKIDNNGSRSHKALLVTPTMKNTRSPGLEVLKERQSCASKEFALTTRPKNPAVALLSSFSTRFS